MNNTTQHKRQLKIIHQKKRLGDIINSIQKMQSEGWELVQYFGQGSQLHNELPHKIKETEYAFTIILKEPIRSTK